jgi:transcriptional regulator with XRE-family HTH domain
MRFNHAVLRDIMNERGLNIPQVSELTGLSVSKVHDLIKEKTKSPRDTVINRLAVGLGVEWLLFFTPDVQEKEMTA